MGFSCFLDPDGFSLSTPQQGPHLIWWETGEEMVCISEPASWEMLARVEVTKGPAGGVEEPRKDSAEVHKISSPSSVLLGAGLNF